MENSFDDFEESLFSQSSNTNHAPTKADEQPLTPPGQGQAAGSQNSPRLETPQFITSSPAIRAPPSASPISPKGLIDLTKEDSLEDFMPRSEKSTATGDWRRDCGPQDVDTLARFPGFIRRGEDWLSSRTTSLTSSDAVSLSGRVDRPFAFGPGETDQMSSAKFGASDSDPLEFLRLLFGLHSPVRTHKTLWLANFYNIA